MQVAVRVAPPKKKKQHLPNNISRSLNSCACTPAALIFVRNVLTCLATTSTRSISVYIENDCTSCSNEFNDISKTACSSLCSAAYCDFFSNNTSSQTSTCSNNFLGHDFANQYARKLSGDSCLCESNVFISLLIDSNDPSCCLINNFAALIASFNSATCSTFSGF